MHILKRSLAAAAGGALLVSQLVIALPAQAAVQGWQKGVNIVPTSTTDFASATFQESLRDFAATGGNAVSLVVPLYQSDTHSTDVRAGYNTPTDEALSSAIDYAHSLGLSVAIKVHIEPYSGEWRAYINPNDRDAWFNNYGDELVHLGQLSQQHGVELLVLGTELVSMAADSANSTNTQHWLDMIARVREVYKGSLTYNANSDSNNEDPFIDEKSQIKFWSALDYAGLSVYYNLNSDSSVEGMKGQWEYWNSNDLRAFQQRIGKPLLFLEIGYRSIDNAHSDPWNWERSGAYNAQEQANAYEALMSYWNNYSYLQGVYWWKWESNPAAGGEGDTGYTPQHKPASEVLKKWFTSAPAPGVPGSSPALAAAGSSNPASPQINQTTELAISITNTGGALQDSIIDIEVYDQSNTLVFQQYFDNQDIASGESREYRVQWVPGYGSSYRVAAGVFIKNWAQNIFWDNEVAAVSVDGEAPATSTPPVAPGDTQQSGATSIWWPSDGAAASGVQPFKALLEGIDLSTYQMFWQVDGDRLNPMSDSNVDWPHKEALVDFSGWNWHGAGPYLINFISTDFSGNVIADKSVNISVAQ